MILRNYKIFEMDIECTMKMMKQGDPGSGEMVRAGKERTTVTLRVLAQRETQAVEWLLNSSVRFSYEDVEVKKVRQRKLNHAILEIGT